MSKLMGLGHSEVVDILNFDSFGALKSYGRGCMAVRRTQKERPVRRSYGVHTIHNTGDGGRGALNH